MKFWCNLSVCTYSGILENDYPTHNNINFDIGNPLYVHLMFSCSALLYCIWTFGSLCWTSDRNQVGWSSPICSPLSLTESWGPPSSTRSPLKPDEPETSDFCEKNRPSLHTDRNRKYIHMDIIILTIEQVCTKSVVLDSSVKPSLFLRW